MISCRDAQRPWAARLSPSREGDPRAVAGRDSPSFPAAGGEFGIDLVLMLRLLRRRWRLAALLTIAVTALAAAMVASLPATYRAEALMVLDPRRSKVGELQAPTEALLSRTQSDLSVLRTETELLGSPLVVREVARRLRLAEADPAPGLLGVARERALAWLRRWSGGAAGGSLGRGSPTLDDAERRLDRAAAALARQVEIANEGGAYTIRVRAEARDPVLAANIANAVAEVHLEQQQARQAGDREAESGWLRDRLDQLRRTVLESDAAVEAYRTRHRLGVAPASSALEARITELNSAVTAARTRLSRQTAGLAEATRSLRQDDGQSAPAVLASPLMQELSVQEATLLGRRSELQQAMGARHPAILDLDAQLLALHARLEIETRRIIAGLRAEVLATRNEISDLDRQLTALEDQREGGAAATVELAELERRAAANREIYAQVLAQFSASLVRQAGSLTEVRLVAAARPPLDPAGPKRKLLVVGAGLAAAALGALTALALGLWRAGFGGAAPLEQATGLATLELVPELNRRDLRRARRGAETSTGRLAAIRSLAIMLDGACDAAGPRTALVLVTSSLRAEGKSFCAGQLALLIASLGRRRVLLADLDFWRPAVGSLAADLRAEPTGRTLDDSTLLRDGVTGLEMLPVAGASPPGLEPAASFARRLAALGSRVTGHDIVVLDAPPVLAVPDVLAAAGAADATLFVVRFERTRAEAVRAALTRLAAVGARPLGTVLSRVVLRDYRRYGYARTEIQLGEA